MYVYINTGPISLGQDLVGLARSFIKVFFNEFGIWQILSLYCCNIKKKTGFFLISFVLILATKFGQK